ncbi:hypothetical protein HanIR_Chr10g0467561 [Helianthus annuus]|nr:hypothetical protein HanIR_Chr10g0467561 [Helianthus annuus]
MASTCSPKNLSYSYIKTLISQCCHMNSSNYSTLQSTTFGYTLTCIHRTP